MKKNTPQNGIAYTGTQIAVFRGKEVRKTIYKKEWWFVVSDVIELLTDSVNVRDYIKKMRSRDTELAKGWVQFVTPLSIQTSGGIQKLACANTEGIFRIIQSIPSPKAEPFKRWPKVILMRRKNKVKGLHQPN
jgi:DNA-damage-inducible protein D